jgi:hypothetical protein
MQECRRYRPHVARDSHLVVNPDNTQQRYVVDRLWCGILPNHMTYRDLAVKANNELSTKYKIVYADQFSVHATPTER